MARGKYIITAKFKGRTIVGKKTFRTKKTATKAIAETAPYFKKRYKNTRITTGESIARSVMRGKKIFAGKYGRKPLPKQRAKKFLATIKK